MIHVSKARVASFVFVVAIVAGCAGSRFDRTEGVSRSDAVPIGWQADPANRSALARQNRTALVVRVVISTRDRSITLSQPQILVVDAPPARSDDEDAIEIVAVDMADRPVGSARVPRRRFYVSEERGLVEAKSQSFVATVVLEGRPASLGVEDGPDDLSATPLDVSDVAASFCERFSANPICRERAPEP